MKKQSQKPKKIQEAPPRPLTRLFLVTPHAPHANFGALLSATLQAADVASVLIWGVAGDPRMTLKAAKEWVPLVQGANAAAMVRADTLLVGRSGADGFHSDGGIEDLRAAIADLQPDRLVGAANLRSRHDAMEAGEAGADYVFFGNLEPGDGRGNASDLLIERAEWWQPIFEIPCVVHAPTLDLAAPLAAAGADFVALGEALWREADPAAALHAVGQAIRRAFTEGAA